MSEEYAFEKWIYGHVDDSELEPKETLNVLACSPTRESGKGVYIYIY